MRIINLIENTEGGRGCITAHGLSFYIETERHRVLMDAGPSGRMLLNAERLGVDLGKVDVAVLSHGHYDHSGGMLPFAGLNPHVVIYVQDSFDGEYYSADFKDGALEYRYIGVAPELAEHPQVKRVCGDFAIDEELRLFVAEQRDFPLPSSNRTILVKEDDGCAQVQGDYEKDVIARDSLQHGNGLDTRGVKQEDAIARERFDFTRDGFVQDQFRHEQCLVISEGGRHVLFSGCAHNGILNILNEYRRKFGGEPDVVLSGFHLMKASDFTEEDVREIRGIAERLREWNTRFYTCHCTGLPAFEILKTIMGDQLQYVHSGDEVRFCHHSSGT